MDNLAHTLVGLAAAKAGLEKLSPAATSVCILSANAADLDVFSGLFGDRWTVLHYHRGITHSIAGTFLLSLIIPAVFYAGDLAISHVRRRPHRLSLRGLLLASLIAGATHPLLDWTNNYGIRLLLPWSRRWFYGDLVFIVDPVLWLIFGGAIFLLSSKSKWQVTLWALLAVVLTFFVVYGATRGHTLDHPGFVLALWISAVIALVISNRIGLGQRFGHKLAVAAFVLMFAYLGGLALLHSRALARAGREASALAAKNQEQVMRLAAMPMLANPTHWRCIAETDRAVYRFDLFLTGDDNPTSSVVRYPKQDQPLANAIGIAARDRRAQIFFEFARFPVERVVDSDCVTETLVQFADLRYTEPGKSSGNFSLELPVECPTRR